MNVDVGSLQTTLPQIITAIGALGTAAMGLLEALKPVFPQINKIGFGRIQKTVSALTPGDGPAAAAAAPPPAAVEPAAAGALNALPQSGILQSLQANWINGTDLTSQKAIAKSLIKLHLNASNAAAVASVTSVDPAVLTDVVTNQSKAIALSQPQSDLYSRFDLIVTAILDECYQWSDQTYRNWTRALAAGLAVILAIVGMWMIDGAKLWCSFWLNNDFWIAVLAGILATPLAPVAKDLSSALATAVNTMQLVKKVGAS
jgi:hypothetical protein